MRVLVIAIVMIALGPTSAFAYVGPGGGLSLIGALWGLIAAIGFAMAFIIAWPVRKMMRNRRPPARTNKISDDR